MVKALGLPQRLLQHLDIATFSHRFPLMGVGNGAVHIPILPRDESIWHGSGPGARVYLIATAMDCGPTSGSTRVCEKPASRIQAWQSAPVKSHPPGVSISMFKLMSKPIAFSRRSSSMIDS